MVRPSAPSEYSPLPVVIPLLGYQLTTDSPANSNHQAPRYRCPRCSGRTCSLPCYKRHQQWSQCSGRRDRAAFVAKSQLTTPAGIDHDYNFLSGIERTLDKAERVTTDKGVRVHQIGPGGKIDLASRTRNVQQRYKDAQVIVKYAPLGMARQKLNRTQWNGKCRCITWRIEWVGLTGLRKLDLCDETCVLAEAYARALHQTTSGKAKKKKRHIHNKALAENGDHSPKQQLPPQQPNPEMGIDESSKSAELDILSQPPSQNTGDTPHAHEPVHFYLHKTLTRAVQPVLIPLSSSDTISSCLKNRIVLEFPTIYALPYPPEQLPEDYISESEYFRRRRADKEGEETTQGVTDSADSACGENHVEMMTPVANEIGEEDGEMTDEGEGPIVNKPIMLADGTAMDQGKLLDVVKQDVGQAL